MNDHGLVLLVGSGSRQYRDYLLTSAPQRDPLWLLDGAAPTWQAQHVVGTTVVELLDRSRLIPDQAGLVAAANEIARTRRVRGVLSYDETLVVSTAHIAESLGLPGLTASGAENCRNKQRTRTALTEAGLLQPGFSYAADADAARAAADRLGYPVIVKPRGMGASIGVIRADDGDGVTAAFAVADQAGHGGAPSYAGGVLVEEFLTGPEISIDGAVHGGEYQPFFVARKEVGLAPFNEEIGHIVSATDPLLADQDLQRMLAAAHRALAVRDGITHTEVKLTPRGPAIVEVNARLGGDLIPYIGQLATGIDPMRIALDLAKGVRPRIEPTREATVGIRFCYPRTNGVVQSVTVPVPDQAAGLLASVALVEPGTRLCLPPEGYLSRYAYLVCTGPDIPGCAIALTAAADRSVVVLAPEVSDRCG